MAASAALRVGAGAVTLSDADVALFAPASVPAAEFDRAAGRLQAFPGTPPVLVDVAHNPQAARELAAWLERNPVPGRTLAVFGALADKDVGGILAALGPQVAGWFGAALGSKNGKC